MNNLEKDVEKLLTELKWLCIWTEAKESAWVRLFEIVWSRWKFTNCFETKNIDRKTNSVSFLLKYET
jgi:hypothetical protein